MSSSSTSNFHFHHNIDIYIDTFQVKNHTLSLTVSDPYGQSLTRLKHEVTRSVTTPPWMGC